MAEKIYDWDKVDWSLQDVEICKLTGATRQRVNQVRKARGEPDPERRKYRTESARVKLEALDTSRHTLEELSLMLGVKESHIRNVLKEIGKSYRVSDGRTKTKYRWDDLSYEDFFGLALNEVANFIGNGCSSAAVALRRSRTKKKIYGEGKTKGLLEYYPDGSFFNKGPDEIDSELRGKFPRGLIDYVWIKGNQLMKRYDGARDILAMSSVEDIYEEMEYVFDRELIEYVQTYLGRVLV